MGSYKEIKGDLLTLFDKGTFDVIVHGANCFNIMGAGIALDILKQYPQAFKADSDFEIPVGSINRLGTFSYTSIKNKGVIVNAYTQYKPGRNFNILVFYTILIKINMMFKGQEIGFPLIGCGIGGGNEVAVISAIKSLLKDCNVTVVRLNK